VRGRVYKTTGGELYQCALGGFSVIVSGSRPYSEACWAEYIQICRDSMKADGMPKVVLNWAPIVGPNAAQRKRFNVELAPELEIERVALVSDMALVRGALLAMTWFTQGKPVVRPFSPAHLEEGLAWLRELYDFALDEARELLTDLVRQQGDDPVGFLTRTDFEKKRTQRM
jgi:hypothetical protein